MKFFGDDLRLGVLRGGVLGIGGNGPDKQKEAAAQGSLTNVFNYGMDSGKGGQAEGSKDLTQAKDYWHNLLSAGRTETATNSAPAVNSAIAGNDARREQRAQFGTGRTGGASAVDAESGADAQAKIDAIVNSNLVGGREAGAKGLATAGGTELQNALALLGLGTDAQGKVLASAQADRSGVRDAQTQVWSQVIKGLL